MKYKCFMSSETFSKEIKRRKWFGHRYQASVYIRDTVSVKVEGLYLDFNRQCYRR